MIRWTTWWFWVVNHNQQLHNQVWKINWNSMTKPLVHSYVELTKNNTIMMNCLFLWTSPPFNGVYGYHRHWFIMFDGTQTTISIIMRWIAHEENEGNKDFFLFFITNPLVFCIPKHRRPTISMHWWELSKWICIQQLTSQFRLFSCRERVHKLHRWLQQSASNVVAWHVALQLDLVHARNCRKQTFLQVDRSMPRSFEDISEWDGGYKNHKAPFEWMALWKFPSSEDMQMTR